MKPFVSVVIPCKNEEESVKKLYLEIKEVLSKEIEKQRISDFEVIYINDGSTDQTQKALEELKGKEGERLKAIQFTRNFAKAEAYKAGFEIVKGDLVFTMDGDLQDNPYDMPAFLDKINKGYDLVVGWKYLRKDPIAKKFPSKIFNLILRSMTKSNLHDFDCGYRLMKRKVMENLDLYAGLYRHIPVFAAEKGFKLAEVKVHHRARQFGKSKYGFSRIFGGFFDLITIRFLFIYKKKPLHFFGGIGSLFFLIGFVIAVWLSILRIFYGTPIGEWPLLTLSVLLIIVGIQLILFGLLGELIANANKKEKNYVIKKVI